MKNTNTKKGLLTNLSKGFTLIELLVVIAVVAILAVIVMAVINPANRIAASKNARVRADLASIGRAAALFYTDSSTNASCAPAGSYPQAFGATNGGCSPAVAFMASLNSPDGTAYTINVSGAAASCTAASGTNPCTGFAVSGPSYNDGTIVTTNGNWCWKASTGAVVQAATCTAP